MAFTLARCYGATGQPSGPPQPSVPRLPHPTASIATQCPATLPRQLLLPQWSCPCNCFHCQSVQVHFCPCCQEGGGGGWEAATRGGASLPTSRQHASSDHLMSRFSIHRREWCKRNLLLFFYKSHLQTEDLPVTAVQLLMRDICIFMNAHQCSHTQTHTHTFREQTMRRIKCPCQLGVAWAAHVGSELD